MRFIVCGGRHYHNRQGVFKALDALHAKVGITMVIDGGMTGADRLGRMWAISRGVPFKIERAEWGKYGNAAGPIRNGVMLTKYLPNGLVAFPGNDGTADMIRKAEFAGVTVWEPMKGK